MEEGTQRGLIGMTGDSNTVGSSFRIHTSRLIRNVFISSVLIELALFLLDFSVDLWSTQGRPGERPFRHLFLLSREDGLGSWLGTLQTLFAGFTLLLIYLKVKKDELASKWTTVSWGFLASFFLFWALDDGVQIHERVDTSISMILKASHASSSDISWIEKILIAYPSYPIHLIIVPVFGGIGIYILIFLWRELTDSLGRFLPILACVFFAMSLAIDFS